MIKIITAFIIIIIIESFTVWAVIGSFSKGGTYTTLFFAFLGLYGLVIFIKVFKKILKDRKTDK
ncbi:MAG: hypothetical protein PQJ46_03470 [Spirochaetales bacterium]|nr:hypothetical protein [Spirochaetales bacterium]